jgi:hypothetical protein
MEQATRLQDTRLPATNKELVMAEPVGRPLKWKTVEDLQAQIDAYFTDTPKEEWTITGLAIALDTSRKVLVEYVGRDDYSNAVKKAKMKIENGYEIDLKKHGRSGTIFALKNFNWSDKQELDVTSKDQPLQNINVVPVQLHGTGEDR